MPRHRAINLASDFSGLQSVADLSGTNFPHIADWPHRFSSWALDDLANTHVWLDRTGRIIGWVVLQTPFWAIDCHASPTADPTLYIEMMRWALSRASVVHAQSNGRPVWFVSVPESATVARGHLESLGFADQSRVSQNPWSKVLLELPHDSMVPARTLPEGLRLRNLHADTEIQAYVDLHRAAFASDTMTLAWRERLIRMPGYMNELDLVISSPVDELVGFCVSWLRRRASGELVGQIEPLGVHPDYRGQKLSRQLMGEAVWRLRRLGATQIFVETDRQRSNAMAAYHSIGFLVTNEVIVYRYNIA